MLWMFEREAEKQKNIKNYQFWTHENHAILLYSNDFIKERLQYIHDNPVRAGIVEKPEDYLYSSARNYSSLENLLDINLLSVTWKTYN